MFLRVVYIRSRFSHILGFHLTSGKTKIKNFEFSSSSGRSQFQTTICWPVFSLVGYFVLKIEHRVFPQCVTCVTSALGNMLRARKYLFALGCIHYVCYRGGGGGGRGFFFQRLVFLYPPPKVHTNFQNPPSNQPKN